MSSGLSADAKPQAGYSVRATLQMRRSQDRQG
jgi:hypothetical protein